MRSVLAILITLLSCAPLAAQPMPADRTRIIEALERLLETGEPRHASHDEGEWLQAEVDRAFAVNDVEIMRLAQRAAAPVVARVSAPASATNEPLQLTIVTSRVLRLKTPVDQDVELWATVDGDEQVRLGALALDRGESFDTLLPSPQRAPGCIISGSRPKSRSMGGMVSRPRCGNCPTSGTRDTIPA